MPKFQAKAPSAPATQTAPAPTPAPAPVEEVPSMVQHSPKVAEGELQDIMSDTPVNADRDQPNTKYSDQDIAASTFMQGGRRVIQTDALARALNASCYYLDAVKPWGVNPLGGHPIPVIYTREFPEKKILYDHIGASPETNSRETVEKVVAFKKKLANDHGYVYLYQHAWCILTSTELDKQLADQKK